MERVGNEKGACKCRPLRVTIIPRRAWKGGSMEERIEIEVQKLELKDMRESVSLNRREFAESFGIPLRTVEDWEAGRRKMPEYLLRLMGYKLRMEAYWREEEKRRQKEQSRNVNIIHEPNGKRIVLINDIRFKGKNREEWAEIEEYLKEYVGEYYEIEENSDIVYIDSDFPDEYANSESRLALKGPVAKAKANASQGLPELIQIATGETYQVNTKKKHAADAKFGWYRYDVRFALPVYDDKTGKLARYNIYSARMLVRHAKDGKKYLYDFLSIKKEASSPLE